MSFYPETAPVPAALRTDDFLLQPLGASHVALDYEALMDSKEMLRTWSQSDWPADDFTLADNLADLERHAREHVERQAFTYTVLDPAAKTCLGCVYVKPPPPALWDGAVCGTQVVQGRDHVADVCFWVRRSRLADDLDKRLLAVLRTWFEQAWAFDRVVFHTARQDKRQVTLFGEAALTPCLAFPPHAARWVIYG
ncbi:MAG: N-acetyltransferase [Anaerolineae bacterium]|nr:N-acetyltransferase [Anaerolineae bacterium]